MKKKIIMWFRQDLRLSDNPALNNCNDFAKKNNCEIMPIYIFDNEIDEGRKIGSASKWWLHHSLQSLNKSLDNKLNFYQGEPLKILQNIIKNHEVEAIFWNRRYEPLLIKKDTEIKKHFREKNLQVESFNGSLLWEPLEVLKDDKTPYKVFTHFYRKGCLLNALPPKKPSNEARGLNLYHDKVNSVLLDDLKLLPKIKWDKIMQEYWHIGEENAYKKMQNFVKNDLSNYKIGRDFPNLKKVSQLSPHLHFGEISPQQIWYYTKENYQEKAGEKNLDHFLSELGWREFSYYLLYHFPKITKKNLNEKFDNFSWQHNAKYLKAWQRGQTGYPIVDAGMRELWQTGYMHNRVRMIVGSFLVKNLLIDWRVGEDWFFDCLVDADLASNVASWQWVAGSGADAAPYFRIFNPVLQGEKFDEDGAYTKKYVPELKNLPGKYLYKPWEASSEILQKAGIILGKTYPHPIVNIDESRHKALEAFKQLPKKESE